MFYKGFKTALQHLLTETLDMKDTKEILLIHGFPQIGKSSLAKCLAYYLALADSSAVYVKMHYTSDLDIHVATDNVSSYFDKGRWIILDQCNTNCLDLSSLQHQLTNRDGSEDDPHMPIVIFTSGHYPPLHSWIKSKNVSFKVVSLSVDEGTVDKLKEKSKIAATRVDTQDVLKVTTMYWRVWQVLCHCNTTEEEVTRDEMEEVIYQVTDLDYDGISKFFMMVWPDFVNAKPEDIKAKTKPEEWQIHPDQMQYLGFLLTGDKDPQDCDINTLLNWMCISGKEVDEDMSKKGYHEYESHYYYFPFLERLHRILLEAHRSATPQKLYYTFLDMFRKLSVLPGSNVQDMRGKAFEHALKYYCESSGHGLYIHGRKAQFTKVDKVCKVHSVSGLVKEVEEFMRLDTVDDLWCVLNVENKRDFPEYDFAYAQKNAINRNKLSMFQLLQVAVNPARHNTTQILKIYNQLQARFGSVVEPYFVAPDETVVGKDFVSLKGSDVSALVTYIQLKEQTA